MGQSNRLLDLRFLIGLLFLLYGVILSVYGLVVHPQSVVSWNINFWWGVVLFVFGALFFLASFRTPDLKEE
jgi:pilus assembly protein TadC